ncbi:redox-sensing transcriptional repressor Rex [Antrihabitans sp. NCIMB 15449]|uniref:Redox-sensing transcriptional repressor Rex n=1 Tax=Antrihabitans spumae TaxID=3373370 RepID=A0ABW7JTL6_9NOCA
MTEQHPAPGVRGVSAAPRSDGLHSTKSLHAAKDIPQATVSRLATYLRVLSVMVDEGTLIVSSEELAAAAGVGSAKLRKDLSFLGPNGVRGVGYDVSRLRDRIETALGLDQGHRVVLVGVGNLGRALAGYGGFGRRGFAMVGLFDTAPGVVGTVVSELEVRDAGALLAACIELQPTIAVIAVPDEAAQTVCDRLVEAGLRCILSFTPVELEAPDHVEVRRVDLAVEMQMLSFRSARNAEIVDAEAATANQSRVPSTRLGRSRGPRSAATAASAPAQGTVANTTTNSKGSVVRQ